MMIFINMHSRMCEWIRYLVVDGIRFFLRLVRCPGRTCVWTDVCEAVS